MIDIQDAGLAVKKIELHKVQQEWARIDLDGTWWVNLPRRGWVRVDDVLEQLDEQLDANRKMLVWAVSLSASAVVGVLLVALRFIQ